MKKLLLFILLIAISCNNVEKRKELPISDFNVDFPVGDTIAMSLKHKFNITPEIFGYNILDSVIFMFEINNDNIGHCYNINSGEVISVIANRGRADNEMIESVKTNNIIFEDSIMLHDHYYGVTKTFSINDILTKPASERKCSKAERLQIDEKDRRKIGNGITFGTYGHMNQYDPYKLFFIYDNKDSVSYIGDIRPELYNLKDLAEIKEKFITSRMHISSNKNKVIAAIGDGLYLNVIDINKKCIEYERIYNKFILGEISNSGGEYQIFDINSNDKNIVCLVTKRNQKYRAQRITAYDVYLLVYDWELNPIKRFNLGEVIGRYYACFHISNDCEHIYYLDIDEEKEEQRLMVGKIDI